MTYCVRILPKNIQTFPQICGKFLMEISHQYKQQRIADMFSNLVASFIACSVTANYRAMHLSAKRGLAIACCPSVRLSVTLVDCDHIGWKSWKLIARTISPTPSLFVSKRRSTSFQENMGKFWGD